MSHRREADSRAGGLLRASVAPALDDYYAGRGESPGSLKKYRSVPVEPLKGKIVIDTNNYYPRLATATFPELDSESTTTSELLQAHLRLRKS